MSLKKKKKAHYAGGLGHTVQAGGLWGVIRAVTAGITVVPPLLEKGGGWRRGQVVAGKFWTLAKSYRVLCRVRVTWDWADGTGRAGCQSCLSPTAGKGVLSFGSLL